MGTLDGQQYRVKFIFGYRNNIGEDPRVLYAPLECERVVCVRATREGRLVDQAGNILDGFGRVEHGLRAYNPD